MTNRIRHNIGCYYLTTVHQDFVRHDHNGFFLFIDAYAPTSRLLYVGDFKCGKMTGTGTFYFQDGTAIQSKVKDGTMYGTGIKWSAGCSILVQNVCVFLLNLQGAKIPKYSQNTKIHFTLKTLKYRLYRRRF